MLNENSILRMVPYASSVRPRTPQVRTERVRSPSIGAGCVTGPASRTIPIVAGVPILIETPATLHGLSTYAGVTTLPTWATRHSCARRAARHAGAPPASTRRDQGLIQLFDTASIDNSLTLSP
ncbi:hypothetical protein [Lysobacter gummosus]|uniref:hypothetical protein n=1 Tax=Lysobacter gummosus TaxID=262324 RepID=UPI00364559F2